MALISNYNNNNLKFLRLIHQDIFTKGGQSAYSESGRYIGGRLY